MFDPEFFARQLKKHRMAQGMTQTELADLLGVTAQSVSKWERGESLPDMVHLSEISHLLHVPADTLLHENAPAEQTYIAIDSGLRTEFVLINAQGRVLNAVTLGESKPKKFGVDTAFALMRQGIDLLRPHEMNVQGIFLRGGSFDGEELRLLLAREYPGIRVGCDLGILSLMEHSGCPEHCLAASAGGGVVIYGNDHGRIRRTGGQGFLFQDGGNSYSIGREALIAALAHRDGTGEPTALTDMVEDMLGARVWDSVDRLYLSEPDQIIGFAPLVGRAYRQGDAVAGEILERNSRCLVGLIHSARKKTPGAKHLVLTGNLFSAGEDYYAMVARQLDRDLTVKRVLWPAVWDACLKCLKLCGVAEEPSLDLFIKTRDSFVK